jgi:uncharacterized protein (DUF1778 family)
MCRKLLNQKVIAERDVTDLSRRDRDVFVAMLDYRAAKPNLGLTAAVERYKKQVG